MENTTDTAPEDTYENRDSRFEKFLDESGLRQEISEEQDSLNKQIHAITRFGLKWAIIVDGRPKVIAPKLHSACDSYQDFTKES
ncbi:hypothetical protein KC669_03465 [Candidatus Dojkabacteria bacterium]|uniref:Uncharacterized protein n=1 Tax=Candidatus Dojkabacteria bacterium TaxID=2099670 RepID=A0A955LB90_9BACT|nr:hypothetical protein [Candidatus Dojkabacteria bacterium]